MVKLEWTDNSDNESGFKIERKLKGDFVLIAVLPANEVSYQDDNLEPETTCYYRVSANNFMGDSGYSNQAQATTSPLFFLKSKRLVRSSLKGNLRPLLR
ncbi:MAG: fibronectin type III domain-containing protein [bacterium]|nr:fibronectin type III domain-containing protein [bacterium]